MRSQIGQANMRLASPGISQIIVGIIAIGKSLGWWAEAEWDSAILGKFVSNTVAVGGILDELERGTGETYPEIRKLKEEAVFAWWNWDVHRWEFWRKAELVQVYNDKLKEFANAVVRKAETWAKEHKIPIAGLMGVWDWIKANLPLISIGAGFATLIGVILAVKRK